MVPAIVLEKCTSATRRIVTDTGIHVQNRNVANGLTSDFHLTIADSYKSTTAGGLCHSLCFNQHTAVVSKYERRYRVAINLT